MTTTHTYHVPGAVLTEREHRVPLDHAGPDGRSRFFITVVDEPPSVCPAPPTGDFGMVSTFGGFQIVDTP